MNNEIKIPRYLDSENFYSPWFLNRINRIEKNEGKVLLDFSETIRIDPVVIPNLLCLGKLIINKTGEKGIIYLPDTLPVGYLKNYLDQIHFTQNAVKYDLFDFSSNPYGGLQGKTLDFRCQTKYFDGRASLDEISFIVHNEFKSFSDKYLSQFVTFGKDAFGNEDYHNDILEFIYEAEKNTIKYAKTASFVTFQSKYKDKTIYISISDMGKGFKYSFNRKKMILEKYEDNLPMTEEEYNEICNLSELQKEKLRKADFPDEREAILTGIRWENQSKIYGLSNVIRKIFEYHGWVRIHSNDTQIILDEKHMDILEDGESSKEYDYIIAKVTKNIIFPGVHIEMIIPMREIRKDAGL